MLYTTHRKREVKTYYIQNQSDQERSFTIDHLIRTDWKLLTGNGENKTGPGVYRYQVKVPADQVKSQTIIEEATTTKIEDRVKDMSVVKLRQYAQSSAASKAVKQALEKTVEMYLEVAKKQHQVNKTAAALAELEKDQSRLRSNLTVIPQSSDAYKGFLQKFVTQETRIEELQTDLRQKQAALDKQNDAYQEYVERLTVK